MLLVVVRFEDVYEMSDEMRCSFFALINSVIKIHMFCFALKNSVYSKSHFLFCPNE